LLLVSRVATAVIFTFNLAGLHSSLWLNLNLFTVVIAAVIYSIVFFGFEILDPIPTAHGVVIEQMHEGVLVLDIQQRIVDMYPSAGRILGLSLSVEDQDWLGRRRGQVPAALEAGSALHDHGPTGADHRALDGTGPSPRVEFP
jgi:PAS domain-containing protein